MAIEQLPASASALLGVVFLLGLRHGLDADHLATIDGLTRFNMAQRPRLARRAGVLFSLGHGAVVMLVALAVGFWAQRWGTPAWLEILGAWTSIVFLTALGLLNLAAVLRSPGNQVVRSVGLRSRFFTRFSRSGRPLAVVLIGALFALSFDTVSQTSLFALAAQHVGGLGFSLLLGMVFTVGMLVTDGANGLWVARLLYRTDRRARVASRVLGLTIAGLSLLVALFGIVRLYSPQVSLWSDGRELLVAAAVVLTLLLSFVLSLWLTRETRLS
jgi:high-affinity nickel-transport protein